MPSLKKERREEERAAEAKPGLVMLKIDGLSFRVLQQSFRRNRLPHLERLSRQDGYRLKPFYSGIPSATPAVQGELFFGVKSSVPAFAFFDRDKNRRMVMLTPSAALEMAQRLERRGKPLLAGGTSYSNIYTGGAVEARYCVQSMRLRSLRHIGSTLKLWGLLALRPLKLLRILGYGLLEAGLAITDFLRGMIAGEDVFKELKFIPTRVMVCILLRELIRTRVKMDVRRGVPIVHASFLGYDEQAHRRGPDSAFAAWTLKGIDATVADIHREMRRSRYRDYRLAVYSDHGQEATRVYEKQRGKSLQEGVAEAVAAIDGDISDLAGRVTEGQMFRPRGRPFLFKGDKASEGPPHSGDDGILITAMGPLGHIYFSRPPAARIKERLARALVDIAGIPLALFVRGRTVSAVNCNGPFDLKTSPEEVVGIDHPFMESVAEDLAQTCRHPNAGDLVISGWCPGRPPLTFAEENGSHGGPGKDETRGFVLVPHAFGDSASSLRPLELRELAFAAFES